MSVVIKSTTVKLSDSMKSKINLTFSKINKRFPSIDATVSFEKERGIFSLSIKYNCEKGGSFQSSAKSKTFYISLSQAADKLTKELSSHFEKKRIGVKVQRIEDFQDVISG